MTELASVGDSPATRASYSWWLLAAAWTILLINFAFPMYGAGVMNGYMAADLGIDRKTIGLGFSIFLLATGLPGLAVAWTINRIGVRATLVLGNVVVMFGATLMATVVRTGVEAALVFGVIIGIGVISGGILGVQTLIARWFQVRRARAMAILLTAIGIGGFVAPPLLNAVIAAFGNWRAGWWLMAGLSAFAAVIAVFCVREFPQGFKQTPARTQPSSGSSAPPKKTGELSYQQAVRTTAFWTVCYCAAAFTALLAFFVSHLVVHLRSLGVNPMTAALAISMMSLASLGGKFLVGIIGNRVPIRLIWSVGFLAMAAGILLAGSSFHLGSAPGFALLCGLGLGVSLVALSTILVDYFGATLFPVLMGVVLTVQTVISATIPLAAGAVFDKSGSYTPVLYSLAGMCVIAVIALLRLKPPALVAES